MTRISRDAYGLKLAEAAALRADCTRRQVGAVIVAEDGSIVSTGYNGLASGRPGCASAGACPRGAMTYDEHPADVAYEETGCRAVHAEVNAIIRAGRERCVGATIYVTDEPCFHCSVVIEGAGIARVVTPEGYIYLNEEADRIRREEAAKVAVREIARRSRLGPAKTEDVTASAPPPSGAARATTPTFATGGYVGPSNAGPALRKSGPLDPEVYDALARAVARAKEAEA